MSEENERRYCWKFSIFTVVLKELVYLAWMPVRPRGFPLLVIHPIKPNPVSDGFPVIVASLDEFINTEFVTGLVNASEEKMVY